MSSVDDPEKHLLGNLLEDDPGSTPSSIHGNTPSERNASSSSISPAIPQLSGIGPIMRPIPNSSMSNAWPEPPPPYTPRVDSWDPIMSNVNTALFSTSIQPVNFTSLPDPKENSAPGSDFLGTFNVSGNSSPMSPSTPTRSPQHTSPHVHHYHWLHHQHTHTHSVQVQNHYFGSPPPGLEAFGPRAGTSAVSTPATPSQSTPQFESATTPRWDYAGLENCKKSSVSFSDWKKENMSQTSPQSTVASESSVSVGSTKKEDQKLSPTHPPLSPSEVVEVAKEKKNISRSYAEHLSKSNTASASTMKGTPIGAEKKQKQELAKKLSSQVLTQHVVTRIQVKDQPHSAPVVSKMPFSYRDVAARVETSSTINPSNHQGETNQERKDTVSKDAKSSDAMSVKSKANDSGNESITSQKTDQSRKSRSDNEFQKINNRKNKKEKNSNVVAAPLIYEGVHPVDASSRYDVLKNLESPTQQRNGKKNANNRPPQIQEIFPSRSSSPADDVDSDEEEEEEIQRTRSASNHNQMNGNNHVKKDQKKQRVVVNNQRRRKGKKTEPTWFDNFCVKLMEFICFVCGNVYYGIEWTMKLIVEVCQRTYDVSVTSSRSLAVGMWRGFWTILVTVVYLFLLLLIAIKKVIVNCLTFINVMGGEEFVELKDMDWGCRKEIPIPTNASEYADRLSRETIRDAYSVLGLKSDCSDDDIKRNYKRLAALVSPDKCNIDAVDDVYELVNLSFACIGFPEARENYIIQFTEINQAHIKLITCWTKMAKAIEESRNTIFCDCNKSHLRIRTTVNPSQARYCRKCDTYHPAKQNDIWAEKRTLSFCYTYYTCTDNVVYDISEWATCESQRALLKNLRAHTHNVQYRLLPPMNSDYDASFLNQAISQSSADTRYMNELSEEYPSLFRQRSLAHISFKNCEPREEDRSRRAANRRQKRWR